MRGREVLPDKLQHEQLVEVSVEQRAGNGIQLPVMIVRASGEVDNHVELTLMDGPALLEARWR